MVRMDYVGHEEGHDNRDTKRGRQRDHEITDNQGDGRQSSAVPTDAADASTSLRDLIVVYGRVTPTVQPFLCGNPSDIDGTTTDGRVQKPGPPGWTGWVFHIAPEIRIVPGQDTCSL